MNIKLVATVVALTAAQVTFASGGFIDESSSNPFSKNHQVKLIGNDNFPVIYGFAREVTLQEALTSIVPQSYNVSNSGMASEAVTKVSWNGGRAWTKVLEDVIAQVPHARVTIDARTKAVDVFFGPAGANFAAGPATVVPVANDQPAKAFMVTAGSTLRSTLNDWTASEGWQPVAWELNDDFVLGATAQFSGSMAEVIEELVGSIQGAGDVRVEIYPGNRVVRVTNKVRGSY